MKVRASNVRRAGAAKVSRFAAHDGGQLPLALAGDGFGNMRGAYCDPHDRFSGRTVETDMDYAERDDALAIIAMRDVGCDIRRAIAAAIARKD